MENNDNNNNDTEVSEDFSDSDDLLYSLTYAIRKFFLAGSWDDCIVGVMLEENEDSFLVALPVRHISVEGQTFAKEISTGGDPFIRLLKAGVRIVTSVEEMSEKLYIEYISQKAPEVFPELLSMIGLEDFDGLLIDGELPIDNEEELKPSNNNDLKGAVLLNSKNTTNEDVDARVRKAIAEGSFIPTIGKQKN